MVHAAEDADGRLAFDVVVTADPATIRSAVGQLMRRNEPVLLDTETSGLDPLTRKLITLQLRQPSSKTTLIIDWRDARAGTMSWELQRLFDEKLVVGHNLKFDAEFLLAQGLQLHRVYDTMLAEQLLGFDEVSLAATLKRRYARDMSKLEREWFYKPEPLEDRPQEWNKPLPQEEAIYAALDVEVLDELYHDSRADLIRVGLVKVAHIEFRALPALAAMELRGVRVEPVGWRAFIETQAEAARAHTDTALSVLGGAIMAERIESYDAARAEWEQAHEELKAEEDRARASWKEYSEQGLTQQGWGDWKKDWLTKYKAASPIPSKPKLDIEPPNIGSQKQLIAGMRRLGIPVPQKKNDKGELVETTDSENLERIAHNFPVIREVLAARKSSKMVDAFGEKVLSYMDEAQRIHPDYHQIGADTGRMSCSNPNWQQVPARGEGSALRKCVIAADGHKLITADFSNIELRIIADLSGDERMLAMFASGEDLHSYTARLMFSLGPEVDPKHTEWRGGLTYRQAAKIVNYLIPYGGSAFAIAMQNNLPVEDAEAMVNSWFGMFGGVKEWMARNQNRVHKELKSVTLSGRVRRFKEPDEPRHPSELRDYRKQWATIERRARNTPVQGLSADITKLAVALFYENNTVEAAGLVAVVHDELVVEAPEAFVDEVAYTLARAMDEAAHTFLKRVELPFPEPTISDVWEHD